ncbi:MAG: biopolymer transporter ExbD [Spirochaetia bacterium]|nr:biopolymer transporter ExbD [Spirochaetia bacterium]
MDEDKGFDYMNVIPLVDVMLVLLTIVLTTSTFIASGLIPVSLPKAEKTQTEDNSLTNKKIIEISKEGNIFMDSCAVSIEELKGLLKETSKDTAVVIRADKGIYLDLFVQVLQAVKKEGFSNVSLQTEAEGSI